MDFISTKMGQEFCTKVPHELTETKKALSEQRDIVKDVAAKLDKQNDLLEALVGEIAKLNEAIRWLK